MNSQTNAQTRAPLSRRWRGTGETNDDPLENLRVDVHDPYILVTLRGTCFRAKYRRQDAPWLATDEYGPEDPEATITSNEFRTLAWAAANEQARQLGWIRSFDELHNLLPPVRLACAPMHVYTTPKFKWPEGSPRSRFRASSTITSHCFRFHKHFHQPQHTFPAT